MFEAPKAELIKLAMAVSTSPVVENEDDDDDAMFAPGECM